ncbi:MAG: TIGR02680 family protein [Bifidobacteriaceae bacterium]|jgi:hypothetical protein|nr:TIGR02680 family protein [Bifidobacteriaceae bacterium]
MTTAQLPAPTRERWTPLRLGLTELYYFEDEQFHFRDGRLLLRGNNGTGKSKVLALTLPFLFDGRLSASRLEPDADRHKAMEWNLLLGGAEDYDERIGYTWLEFGRLGRDGTDPEYFTIGCGLKAVRGRGVTRHWFFTTSRRVGDLKLIDANRRVLTCERLREEIEPGGLGRVYEKELDAYRQALDQKLFGLGQARYGALMDLLIQLRQPQLSRKPNEAGLASALTDSLPPLGPEVLADLAESFRALDEEKRRLEELEASHRAVQRFLREHRRYAQTISRLVAEDVRRTHSAYEGFGRDLGSAQRASQEARQRIDQIKDDQRTAGLDMVQLEARLDALRESEAWADAASLVQARGQADLARERLVQARAEWEAAQANAAKAARQAGEAGEQAGAARAEAERNREVCASHAADAGLAEDLAQALGDPERAKRILRRREEQADRVARAVQAADRQRAEAERAAEKAAEAETRAGLRLQARQEADAAADSARQALLEAVRAYLTGLLVLSAPDPETLVEEVADWSAEPEAWDFPLARRVADLAEAALAEAAGRRQALAAERGERVEQRQILAEELDLLESGASPRPEPGRGRRPPEPGQPARPLFALVDFREAVDQGRRAGLEAALEASGLLDALVRQDGSVADPATGDLLLASGPGAVDDAAASGPGQGGGPVGLGGPPAPDRAAGAAPGDSTRATLDAVMAPDPGSLAEDGPGEDVVRGVLSGIGYGRDAGPVWVDDDGSYGMGRARGRWAKPEAQFVGVAARERRRRARVDEVRRAMADLEREIDRLDAGAAAAAARAAQVRDEREAVPSRQPQVVLETAYSARAASREEAAAAAGAAEAAAQAAEARAQAAALAAEARAIGQDLAIEPGEEGVARLRAALFAFAPALVEARAALDRAGDLERAAQRARDGAGQWEGQAQARRRELDRAEKDELAASERHATLEASVGAAVEDLRAEEGQIAQAKRQAEALRDALADQLNDAVQALGAAEERHRQIDERRTEAAARRDASVGRLRGFAALNLLRIAAPEVEPGALETATAVVALARRIESALADVPIGPDQQQDARTRNSRALTDLRSDLAVYNHAVESLEHAEAEEVRIRYGERELGPDELAREVESAIDVKRQTLSAREREILENYLMADTAARLAELIVHAETWVEGLNRELRGRATSTGVKIRLLWKPDPDAPAGFSQVRGLLLRAGGLWGEADRGVIGDFLQRCVENARAADPAAGWNAHLERAFDYRRWHTFAVERSQGSRWVSGAGPASTGERALGLTLPLFAAAASYYRSAGQLDAPRLILLDEAFAGIDNDARAKAMGLFRDFDLDVVMTSEREWGCYPSVPGLAIAHLSRTEGVAAVHVSRWEWDGAVRARADEPPPRALARAGARDGAAAAWLEAP